MSGLGKRGRGWGGAWEGWLPAVVKSHSVSCVSVRTTLYCRAVVAEFNPFPWLSSPSIEPRGHIEVVTGGMFSGKTEELIRRLRLAMHAKRKVQAFKPRIDDRYDATKVMTHFGVGIETVAVPNSATLETRVETDTQVIGVDEAQFFDAGIVDLVERLADRGVCVLLAGLDQDYLGRPFAPMPQLMAIAEHVTKVYAVCAVCGAPATRSQRIVEQKSTILVGGDESYEPRCRCCFQRRELSRTS